MSIVENIKRLGRPPVPRGDGNSAGPVRAKLAEAEAQLAILRQDYPQAALAAVSEAEGAAERLADLESRIAVQEKQITVLQAALVEAEAADQRLIQQQRAANHRSQYLAVKRLLAQRQEAADRLTIHVENACAEFRRLVELSDQAAHKAQIIRNSSSVWQPNELLGGATIQRAVALELRRQGAHWPVTPENARLPSFPTDAPTTRNPGTIRPLAELVRSADENLLSVLEGREPAKLR
jgi:uncharacterized coiled-coil protein SlyX